MLRKLAIFLVLAAFAAPAPAAAAAKYTCLSKTEQRAAIAGGQAVTLAAAIRAAHGVRPQTKARGRKPSREVVRARLCRGPEGLVYMLTVLSRDGKVTRTTVDARSGKVVEAR
jgi:hypothetical protein